MPPFLSTMGGDSEAPTPVASRRSSMSSGGGPSSARRGPGLGDVMRRLFGDFAEDEDEDDGEDEQVNEGVKEAVEWVDEGEEEEADELDEGAAESDGSIKPPKHAPGVQRERIRKRAVDAIEADDEADEDPTVEGPENRDSTARKKYVLQVVPPKLVNPRSVYGLRPEKAVKEMSVLQTWLVSATHVSVVSLVGAVLRAWR